MLKISGFVNGGIDASSCGSGNTESFLNSGSSTARATVNCVPSTSPGFWLGDEVSGAPGAQPTEVFDTTPGAQDKGSDAVCVPCGYAYAYTFSDPYAHAHAYAESQSHAESDANQYQHATPTPTLHRVRLRPYACACGNMGISLEVRDERRKHSTIHVARVGHFVCGSPYGTEGFAGADGQRRRRRWYGGSDPYASGCNDLRGLRRL